MNFTELVNAVYVQTNRPDLIDETKAAVQEATLSAHTVDLFPRDTVAADIIYPGDPQYYQLLDTDNLLRFRRLFYARKTFNGNGPGAFLGGSSDIGSGPINQHNVDQFPGGSAAGWGNGKSFLKVIDPNAILNSYDQFKQDVCYLAGSNIHMRSSTPLKYLKIGWYAYPLTDEDTYFSWIARDRPWTIIYKATSTIFNAIGFNDMARTFDRPAGSAGPNDEGGLVQQQIKQLIADNLLLGDN